MNRSLFLFCFVLFCFVFCLFVCLIVCLFVCFLCDHPLGDGYTPLGKTLVRQCLRNVVYEYVRYWGVNLSYKAKKKLQ